MDDSVTFILLSNRFALELEIFLAIVLTNVVHEFPPIPQSAPPTIAIRDASVTAYESVQYVHMPLEISMTETMSSIMGIPASANSNNMFPRRDFRYIQFDLVGNVADLVIVYGPEKRPGTGMSDMVW